MADVPGDTSTTEQVTLGSDTAGNLHTREEEDWYRIELEEGYAVRLSTTTPFDEFNDLDSLISIRDASGALIAANDDGTDSRGPGDDSLLYFTPEASGIYFISVASNRQGLDNFGDFTLHVRAAGSIPGGGGTDGDDVLVGTDGVDTLDGGPGADIMTGGRGEDTYFVDNPGDSVNEYEVDGGAIDTVRSSISFSLNENVENLVLTGTAAINGSGNAHDNVVIGNSANNRLKGGAGNDVLDGRGGSDSMDGGIGDDVYIVGEGDSVNETQVLGGTDLVQASISFSINANVENLTLTGVADINGSGNALDNIVLGNAGSNRLKGGAGNDVLDGGLGGDILNGGTGNDTYHVDSASDAVNESADAGYDTVRSAVSFSLNQDVEKLVLTGGAANGSGNALDNRIGGNEFDNRLKGGAGDDLLNGAGGNDLLIGGTGADRMIGGDGNDTIVVDDAGDVASGDGGIDRIESSIAYSLGHTDEHLTLTGSASVNGSGNAADNEIRGNDGANRLKGGDGSDILDGGGGNDLIVGGAGSDALTGGTGDDVFLFNAGFSQGNVDSISDFGTAGNDAFSLSRAFFTQLNAGSTLDASAFRVDPSSLDADDRILYQSATGELFYDRDGSGGAAPMLFAQVAPETALTAADFLIA